MEKVFKLAMKILEEGKSFPKEKRYSLTLMIGVML